MLGAVVLALDGCVFARDGIAPPRDADRSGADRHQFHESRRRFQVYRPEFVLSDGRIGLDANESLRDELLSRLGSADFGPYPLRGGSTADNSDWAAVNRD